MIDYKHFCIRNKAGRFATVDQSEVSSIIGMSSVEEASWLAAGELPWRAGEDNQISMPDLVDLFIRYKLSSDGSAPCEDRETVGQAIAPVFFNAFCNVDYSLEVTGVPEDVERFRQEFLMSTDVADELTGGPHRFAFLYKSGDLHKIRFARSVERIKEITAGSCSCFSFARLASDFCSRLSKPLLSIEMVSNLPESCKTGKWISTAR